MELNEKLNSIIKDEAKVRELWAIILISLSVLEALNKDCLQYVKESNVFNELFDKEGKEIIDFGAEPIYFFTKILKKELVRDQYADFCLFSLPLYQGVLNELSKKEQKYEKIRKILCEKFSELIGLDITEEMFVSVISASQNFIKKQQDQSKKKIQTLDEIIKEKEKEVGEKLAELQMLREKEQQLEEELDELKILIIDREVIHEMK